VTRSHPAGSLLGPLLGLLVASVFLTGCGGGDADSGPPDATVPAQVAAPVTAPEDEPGVPDATATETSGSTADVPVPGSTADAATTITAAEIEALERELDELDRLLADVELELEQD
jgi:hypothetical protein